MRTRIQALAFAFIVTAVCSAQTWKPVGPYGGSAAAIVRDPAHPDRLLAASTEGVLYRSDNDGQQWEALPFPHERSTSAHTMLAVPGETTTFYVGLEDPQPGRCGLYRSRDDGATWEAVPDLCKVEVFALAMFRGDPRVIAAGGHNGVYLTRDGGASWKRISPAANADLQPIMSLAFDPADSNILFAGTPHLPWKTVNGGQSWVSVHHGMIDDSDVFSLEVDGRNSQRVLASACSGIYASQDRGANWVKLMGVPRDSRRTYTIRRDPSNSSIIYAGTSRGLWKSVNGGLAWRQVSPLIMRAIAFDPRDSRKFLAATDNTGIIMTSDGGETTKPVNTGFGSRRLRYLQAGPGGLLTSVLYQAGDSGVYRYSREKGVWEIVPGQGGSSLNILSLAAVSQDLLLAVTYNGTMRSTDGARTWTPLEGPWGNSNVYSISVLRGGSPVTLVATEAGLYRSEDQAATWQMVTPKAVAVKAVYSTAGPGTAALAVTTDGTFFSADRGKTWTKASQPAGADLYDVAIQSENLMLAATSRGLYRSIDEARTWKLVNGAPGSGTVRAVSFHPLRNVAFAFHQDRVYASGDGGVSWTAMPTQGLERCVVEALVIDAEAPEWLYALAKGRGVFALPLENTTRAFD